MLITIFFNGIESRVCVVQHGWGGEESRKPNEVTLARSPPPFSLSRVHRKVKFGKLPSLRAENDPREAGHTRQMA